MYQTIIAEHNDGNDRFRLGIVVRQENEAADFDPVAAVHAAAAEYCQTEEGKQAIQENCGNFNWGDFINSYPEEICRKHGFTIHDTFVTELIVDHNEQLFEA